ncbi:MAG: hypothetical protein NVSMB25_12100 [Thermoleophilaceae bacterium]
MADAMVSSLPSLLRLARRLADDDRQAEDAVQDCLERAWSRRATLRNLEDPLPWLRRILVNGMRDAHRRAGPPTQVLVDDDPQLADIRRDPANILAVAANEDLLRAALARLPEPELVAVVLHDGEGWPARQVAEVSATTQQAVHKRLQRGRHRLVALLAATEKTASPRHPGAECQHARALASSMLDGNLTKQDQDRVQEHIEQCANCPPVLRVLHGVVTALRSGRLTSGSDDLLRDLGLQVRHLQADRSSPVAGAPGEMSEFSS